MRVYDWQRPRSRRREDLSRDVVLCAMARAEELICLLVPADDAAAMGTDGAEDAEVTGGQAFDIVGGDLTGLGQIDNHQLRGSTGRKGAQSAQFQAGSRGGRPSVGRRGGEKIFCPAEIRQRGDHDGPDRTFQELTAQAIFGRADFCLIIKRIRGWHDATQVRRAALAFLPFIPLRVRTKLMRRVPSAPIT